MHNHATTLALAIPQVVIPESLGTLTEFRLLYLPRTSGSPVLSYRQIASMLLCALKNELSKGYLWQDQEYIIELMHDLTKYRHPDFHQIVEAVANTHVKPAVRNLARAIFQSLSESLNYSWDNARMDQISDRDLRARALSRARQSAMDEELVVQMIFTMLKGCDLGLDDGFLSAEVKELFLHHSEKVKLAACWAVMKAWANAGPGLLRETVFTLSDLAVNSRHLGHSNDALQMLKRARELSPFAMSMVRASELEATQKFHKRTEYESSAIKDPVRQGTSQARQSLALVASNPSVDVGSDIQSAQVHRPGQDVWSTSIHQPEQQSVNSLARASFFVRNRG